MYADACPAVVPSSFLIGYDAAAGRVTYRYDTHDTRFTWPEGYSARLNPALEIVAPDGEVVAREGEYTPEWSVVPADGGYRVCIPGNPPARRIDG